jgi:hypothetical protein
LEAFQTQCHPEFRHQAFDNFLNLWGWGGGGSGSLFDIILRSTMVFGNTINQHQFN